MPFVRFWLDAPPGTVGTVEKGASPPGKLLLLPRRTHFTRRLYSRRSYPQVRPPAGYERIMRTRAWRVFGAPGCKA